MSAVEHLTQASYLAAAALFVFSLRWLSSPKTARQGVIAGVAGMSLAVFGTLLHPEIVSYTWIVVALVIASASIGLAVGLLRRWRWAWFATLILEGINVVAMLIGLATQGLGAVASYGVMGMVVSFTVFFYLTRPHVAAAFKRPRAKA